jgi:hypothetical protein
MLAWGLVCSALAWADGVGMTRLLPQSNDNLDRVSASVLEPEVPPEARNVRRL